MAKKKVDSRSKYGNVSSGGSIEKALIENFVTTQKVMVNLSGKLDNLATQISKLLELFEISAKALAEKNFQVGDKDNKKILEKMDSLLNQNKLIARGLTLMHEANSREDINYPAGAPATSGIPPIKTLKVPVESTGVEGYQKSIVESEGRGNFESPIRPGTGNVRRPPIR